MSTLLIKSINIYAALTLSLSLSIAILPHNPKTMPPSSSSSSSSSSSLPTVSNLRLRALTIWASKNYAIAAFVFLFLFSLTLFSHLDSRSRSRSRYPSHPPSSLVPLTLLRNANRTGARTSLTPPRAFLFRLNWIPNFHLCVQFAWTGAPPVTTSKAGQDPDLAIGCSTLRFLFFAFLKFCFFSRIQKNCAREICVYGKQFLNWKIWR